AILNAGVVAASTRQPPRPSFRVFSGASDPPPHETGIASRGSVASSPVHRAARGGRLAAHVALDRGDPSGRHSAASLAATHRGVRSGSRCHALVVAGEI